MRKGFLVAWILVFGLTAEALQAAEPLPAMVTTDAVVVIQLTGQASWPAYQQTASFRAFYESGLVPALYRPLLNINWPSAAAMFGATPEHTELNQKIVTHLWEHGVTLTAGLTADGGLIPYGLVVVPEAGEWAPSIIERVAGSNQETEVAGRKVFRIVEEEAGAEYALWDEQGHLVLYAGPVALESVLRNVDDGKQLARSEAWTSSWLTEPSNQDDLRVWVNIRQLVERYGEIPLPVEGDVPVTINTALVPFGFDKWTTLAYRSGVDGEHIVSDLNLLASSPPTKWLGWQEKRVTLADLPPLPEEVTSFSIQAIDLPAAFQALQTMGKKIGENRELLVGVLDSLGAVQIEIGDNDDSAAEGAKITDFLSVLGSTVCIYHDRRQQVLPWGIPTIAVSIQDRDAVIAKLDALVADESDETQFRRDDRWGCPVYFATASAPIAGALTVSTGTLSSPTIAVCDNWLVVAVQPQPVQTFILRSQGKLPTWNPDQIPANARDKIPENFVRLSYSDPRPAVGFLLKLTPWLSDAFGIALAQIPPEITNEARKEFSPLDIPAAEVVTASLFPNVTITQCSDHGLTQRTYASTTLDNSLYWWLFGYGALMLFGAIS